MAQSDEKIFDVVIIGGGVIGCAVLHELTNHGYRCVLVEKENALVSGASSGNRYHHNHLSMLNFLLTIQLQIQQCNKLSI